MSDQLAKFARIGLAMIKVDSPDLPPQISYDKGETWEELKVDYDCKEVMIELPRFIVYPPIIKLRRYGKEPELAVNITNIPD